MLPREAPVAAAGSAGRLRGKPIRRRWTLHRIHQWVGLFAALWLAVLGATGFILDHRDWHWLWRPALPVAALPPAVAAKSTSRTVALYQVNPRASAQRLAGGRRGLWLTGDGGRRWSRPVFGGRVEPPQIFAIVPDFRQGWKRLWLATDDGVWRSIDGGRAFTRIALPGRLITALTTGGPANSLLGVVDRSQIFRLATHGPRHVAWLDPQPPNIRALPPHIDLSRLVHDLHFGRGVFPGGVSLLLNDLAGFALMLLPLTGLLYWGWPKRWKRLRRAGRGVPAAAKGPAIRWLYRLHAPVVGVAALAPILYLSMTGVLLDHGSALNRWMHTVSLDRAWLPPVYRLRSWQDEIYSVAGYPDAVNRLSVGTRLGLFTSMDGGRTWRRDPAIPGFVWTIRRVGGALFIGGMGSPNFEKTGGGAWRRVAGTGFMPSDMTALPGKGWLWSGPGGIRLIDGGGRPAAFSPRLPRVRAAAWFDLFDSLHSGLLIHVQWKWMNDLFAIAALLLAATGAPRWWRRKWG